MTGLPFSLLLGSSPNAILLLCAHAQVVRVPLTIAPRPRLLYMSRDLNRGSVASALELTLLKEAISRGLQIATVA